MVNIWNAVPVHGHVQPVALGVACSSRGIGRGMGFRDSNQDLLGFVHMVPERARERILDIAATQLPDGGAYHQYQPLTKRGNDAVGSGFNDDPAWLVLAVAAYLKETGDLAILDEPVPYDNAPGTETAALRPPPAGDRLHARAARAARAAAHRPGRLERLPQPQRASPTARRVVPDDRRTATGGVAESVFIAGLFVLAAERAGRDRRAARRRRGGRRAAGRRRRRWSRRSTPTAGTATGSGAPTTTSGARSARRRTTRARSSSSRRGCCVMAGHRPRRRARAHARSPRSASGSRRRTGSCSSSRPTRATSVELGEISSYPPGYKENGGIFCHTNPWLMIAEVARRQRRRRPRLLPADQSVGPRGDLGRPPLRAVRVRADDRRAGRADPRRGEELVADRHRGLELGRDHPVDPRHPAGARRPADRSAAARRTGASRASRAGSAARPIGSWSRRRAPGRSTRLVVDGRDRSPATSRHCPGEPGSIVEVEAFLGSPRRGGHVSAVERARRCRLPRPPDAPPRQRPTCGSTCS